MEQSASERLESRDGSSYRARLIDGEPTTVFAASPDKDVIATNEENT